MTAPELRPTGATAEATTGETSPEQQLEHQFDGGQWPGGVWPTAHYAQTDYTEILVHAAKAAALAGMRFLFLPGGPHVLDHMDGDTEHYRLWRPHEDDGDSRRLEVALSMTVWSYPPMSCAIITTAGPTNGHQGTAGHDVDGGALAATRMAVLLAAAGAGKALL